MDATREYGVIHFASNETLAETSRKPKRQQTLFLPHARPGCSERIGQAAWPTHTQATALACRVKCLRQFQCPSSVCLVPVPHRRVQPAPAHHPKAAVHQNHKLACQYSKLPCRGHTRTHQPSPSAKWHTEHPGGQPRNQLLCHLGGRPPILQKRKRLPRRRRRRRLAPNLQRHGWAHARRAHYTSARCTRSAPCRLWKCAPGRSLERSSNASSASRRLVQAKVQSA